MTALGDEFTKEIHYFTFDLVKVTGNVVHYPLPVT